MCSWLIMWINMHISQQYLYYEASTSHKRKYNFVDLCFCWRAYIYIICTLHEDLTFFKTNARMLSPHFSLMELPTMLTSLI